MLFSGSCGSSAVCMYLFTLHSYQNVHLLAVQSNRNELSRVVSSIALPAGLGVKVLSVATGMVHGYTAALDEMGLTCHKPQCALPRASFFLSVALPGA
jgi:hypothetical protein